VGKKRCALPIAWLRLDSARGAAGEARDSGGFDRDLASGDCSSRSKAYNRLVGTDDRREGMRGVNEKRTPKFKAAELEDRSEQDFHRIALVFAGLAGCAAMTSGEQPDYAQSWRARIVPKPTGRTT